MNKNTKVISAFPACGKTFLFNNEDFVNKYIILDSDSSKFSWIYDDNGNKTNIRNPDFPSNYIKHIKDNIGKVDLIFVSSHSSVREALDKNKIQYTLVYPYIGLKDDWINRCSNRGNDEKFIDVIDKNWDAWNKEMKVCAERHINYELQTKEEFLYDALLALGYIKN